MGDHIKRRFNNLSNVRDPTVVTRVILVEDLSPRLIEALGSTFDIDPEFFAEHLNRSGYHWDSYIHELPARWNTASLQKPYASLKWFKPVRQRTQVARFLTESDNLLRTSLGSNETELTEQQMDLSRSRDKKRGKEATRWTDTHYREGDSSFVEIRNRHQVCKVLFGRSQLSFRFHKKT